MSKANCQNKERIVKFPNTGGERLSKSVHNDTAILRIPNAKF